MVQVDWLFPLAKIPRFQSLNLSVDLVIGLLQPLVHTVESETMLAAIGHLPPWKFFRQANSEPGGYDPVRGDSVHNLIGSEGNTADPFGFWPDKIHPK